MLSGASAGASLPIAQVDDKTVHLIAVLHHAKAAGIAPGDKVRIDNSWTLALQTYHRHQVPPTTDYYGWNQFRDAARAPIYPQRPVLIGPTGTANAAGSVLTGQIHGKILMLACLMEIWRMPQEHFGSFVQGIPSPLGIGRVRTESGTEVAGFLCETAGIEGAVDITRFGGWRAYLARQG